MLQTYYIKEINGKHLEESEGSKLKDGKVWNEVMGYICPLLWTEVEGWFVLKTNFLRQGRSRGNQ